MSCYEWESGTIKLPTAEAPKVRDAVKAAATAHIDALYAHAQKFWKELPAAYKKDKEKYTKAVHKYCFGNHDEAGWTPRDPKLPAWPGVPGREQENGLAEDLQNVLHTVLRHEVTETHTRDHYENGVKVGTRDFQMKNWLENPPRRVQKPDAFGSIGKPTGASFSLNVGEGRLEFKGRVLKWEVYENNHARDRGREHPVARVLFAALDRVKWTRGSGGKIVGNDEYNRDNSYEGGGANYVIDEYGPNVKRYTPTYGRSRW